MIDQKAISEFKQIYLEEFRIGLSDEEATEKAISLLNLFKVLSQNRANLTKDGEGSNNEN